ncbi:hypothetical protein ACPOL_4254 [Acidisarcina polymorpha]|uniref:Uncharacterized protein n=1 Tax=Acidisarcina polymorpha TaxID=2211140 RepID=A0A2Z5G389_9BACT|nr:hypothetical protein ACPOL_4254 [Acidisarcina polymorpha]
MAPTPWPNVLREINIVNPDLFLILSGSFMQANRVHAKRVSLR